MDSSPLRNGIMDARLQPFFANKVIFLVSKVRTEPISISFLEWAVLRKSRSLLVRQRNDASIRGKGRSNTGDKLIATLRLDEKSCRSRCQRFPAHNSIVVCSQDNDPGRR